MSKGKGNWGPMATPKPGKAVAKGGGKPTAAPKTRGDKKAMPTPKGRGKGS
jgi:hypothetical protein